MKFTVVLTVTKEYEFKPKYYPETMTPQEALNLDVEFAKEQPFDFINDENCTFESAGVMK